MNVSPPRGEETFILLFFLSFLSPHSTVSACTVNWAFCFKARACR